MRGEPGDAMARMKRWDAVRQRLEDASSDSAEAAVDEVVRALSEVVQRHPSLTVTVTIDDSADNVTVRIRNGDGNLEVMRIEARPIVGEPRSAVNQPRVVTGEPRAVTNDPHANDPRTGVNEPRSMIVDLRPAAANQPPAWPPRSQAEALRQPDPLRPDPLRPEALPMRQSEPLHPEPLPVRQPEPLRPELFRPEPLRQVDGLRPNPQPFRPSDHVRPGETMDQTAARLAEMIRRDPSLLDVHPVQDPEDRT